MKTMHNFLELSYSQTAVQTVGWYGDLRPLSAQI